MKFKYIKNPVLFQGNNKSKNYFEGWYFKNVTSDLNKVVSFIPGVSMDKDRHAFVQVIINDADSGNVKTHYHRFLLDEFSHGSNPFYVKIGNSKFGLKCIEIDLHDDEYYIKDKINFCDITKIKSNLFCPNTMGFFAYMPFLECYHEIISMNHGLEGKLVINDTNISFNNGKGYAEKDWGISFPKEYIWLQCNNFENIHASIMCSVAHIPFCMTSFKGFICNLTVGYKEYRFATYNFSKIVKLECTENFINICMKKDNLFLEIYAKMVNGGTLAAPKNGSMTDFIKEALNGIISVKLTDSSGKVLFSDTGNCCGIEAVNI